MTQSKKLFLSIVSSEFASHRRLLAKDLKRPNLDVAVQEDFVTTDGKTLAKLDTYIRSCDGVVHVIGKATGSIPPAIAVKDLLQRRCPGLGEKIPPLAPYLAKVQPGFSNTQWEAYLALYHEKPLFIYRAADLELDRLKMSRDKKFVFRVKEARSQRIHYQRVCKLGHDRGQFGSKEMLRRSVLLDLADILPRLASTVQVAPTKLRHTAAKLIGRDAELARLDAAWNDPRTNIIVVRAFGGMGKTSLVATWMAELAAQNWRGAEQVFDWSFYSQGTNDLRDASADTFVAAALAEFGGPAPALGSAWDRGAHLARLIGSKRCLLVLDGLEPLQHPPGPMEGKLKAQSIEALLKGLASHNSGLCVVTTRERVTDIEQHYNRTAIDLPLLALNDIAGAALLHHHGATRAGPVEIGPDHRELRAANREVRGHGLTLQLLGQYLRLVEGGDILKRDTVRLADAEVEYQNDATRPYGHAFKAMEAYERWFEREGEKGHGMLAILRLLGLFDRPASKMCLAALRAHPAIAGLTEPLIHLSERDWKILMRRLADIDLITVQDDGELDAHPLLREYFAMRVRGTAPHRTATAAIPASSDTWREAHHRLFEYLRTTTPDKSDANLEDLQPLYQAVAHGCHAGCHQAAFDLVLYPRIHRGTQFYSTDVLSAIHTELATISLFIGDARCAPVDGMTAAAQGWLFNELGFGQLAVLRLADASVSIQKALDIAGRERDYHEMSRRAANLYLIRMATGELDLALKAAQEIERAGRLGTDSVFADGGAIAATAVFACRGEECDVETILRAVESRRSELEVSFFYATALLAQAERLTWQHTLHAPDVSSPFVSRPARSLARLRCEQVIHIAEAGCCRFGADGSKFPYGIEHLNLALGKFFLHAARNDQPIPRAELLHLVQLASAATTILREANRSHYLPYGLLTRAWLRAILDLRTGPDSAQADLDEAHEIALRGPMPLHLADIHLHRARLFHREAAYPWSSPGADLAEARRLIVKHHYLRRKGELEDAEAVIRP